MVARPLGEYSLHGILRYGCSVDEGHTIRLTLRSTGELPSSLLSSQMNIQEGTGSTLQLDLIDPPRLFYDVPACEHAVCLAHEGNA